MATDTITVVYNWLFHKTSSIFNALCWLASIDGFLPYATEAHNAYTRLAVGPRAGAMPGWGVRIYREIHRLEKLSVNHKYN
tara:strand:- start:348 stop:590 length:243 start_codon:yes stop_codon:yes gene_type:complete